MKLTTEEIIALLPNADLRLDRRKSNLYGKCPQCGEDEFGISLEENHQFGCFRKKKCGFAGNIFTLLQFLGKPIHTAKKGYEAFAEKLENLSTIQESELDLTLPTVTMPIGWKRVYDHPYLNTRGFIKQDYEKYQVGVTKIDPRYKQDFVIFLLYRDAELKGYIARSTKSKEEIKLLQEQLKTQGIDKHILRYKNSSTDFSKLLLGYDEIGSECKTIILVEGLFDKKQVDTLLNLDNDPYTKCCATFKCGCSDEQIYLLQQKGIEQIILFYDPDVVSEIKHSAFILESFFSDVLIGFNKTGNDPGDTTLEQIIEVFETLQTPSEFALNTLSMYNLKN